MGPSIYGRRCAKRGVRKYRAGAYGLKRSTRVELFCQLFSLCPPVEPAGSYNIVAIVIVVVADADDIPHSVNFHETRIR